MRCLRLVVLVAVAGWSSACFQMTTVLKVRGDGAGTIEHRMVYTTAALEKLRQFATLGGGRGGAIDPLSEQQAREMAAAIGPGVTYVTSEPITSPAGKGRVTTYAFTDVSQLRISTQPPAPGGLSIRTPTFSTDAETITFSLARDPGGNAVLQINVPGFTGSFSMLLSNNHATGGTCFGDSGGPNFIGSGATETNIVAAVTSFGINGNCAGTGGVFRMDRQNVLDFVKGYLH